MKLPLLFGSVALGLLTVTASAQNTQTYAGNGAGGFGGPIGGSSLTVTDNEATGLINFTLTAAGNGTGDSVVFYIDSVTGGVNTTANLTDANLNTDAGRRAVTGTDGTLRSTVNFATNFNADYGLVLRGASTTLYQITQPSLTYVAPAAGTPAATQNGNVFTFSINEANLGLAPGNSFSFVANLLNPFDGTTTYTDPNTGTVNNIGVYRSNETLGTSTSSTGGNPANTGTLTFSTADTFTLAAAAGAPEPSTVISTLVFASVLGGGYLVRRRKQGQAA